MAEVIGVPISLPHAPCAITADTGNGSHWTRVRMGGWFAPELQLVVGMGSWPSRSLDADAPEAGHAFSRSRPRNEVGNGSR